VRATIFKDLVGSDGKALAIEQIPNTQAYMSVVKAEVQRPEPIHCLIKQCFITAMILLMLADWCL
jgi:hypothetical protein